VNTDIDYRYEDINYVLGRHLESVHVDLEASFKPKVTLYSFRTSLTYMFNVLLPPRGLTHALTSLTPYITTQLTIFLMTTLNN
jgi:hypothetical protein